jgi:hypothetical protein
MADPDRRESFRAWMRANDTTTAKVAKRAGVPATTLYDFLKGETQTLRGDTERKIAKAYRLDVEVMFGGAAPADHLGNTPDLLPPDPAQDYVTVEVLPTFAGMGGGGTGDADQVRALLPRALIEDDLRGRAEDFLLINLRGNSMVPDFHHGDQVVIDKRDRNPVQPGPFALWDGDGYVVKNVERRRGKYRVFSSNKDYSEIEYEPDDVQIMGRTVWYARRL